MATARPRPLNPRRLRFVAEYLVDLNASAAYQRVYSARGNAAEVNAGQLLRNPQIQAAVAEGQAKRAARTGITQDRVLTEVSLLAFSDLTHYEVGDNGDVKLTADAPAGAMRALQSIKRRITTRGTGQNREVTREVEIRLWDKPGPLKLAGQHVGLFPDRHEHGGKNGQPIQTETRVTFGGRYKRADAGHP